MKTMTSTADINHDNTLLNSEEISFLLNSNHTAPLYLSEKTSFVLSNLEQNLTSEIQTLFSQPLTIKIESSASFAIDGNYIIYSNSFKNYFIQTFLSHNAANTLVNICLGFHQPHLEVNTADSHIREKIIKLFQKKFYRGLIQSFAKMSNSDMASLAEDTSILLQIGYGEIKIHLRLEKDIIQCSNLIKATVKLPNVPVKIRDVLSWHKGTYISLPFAEDSMAQIDSAQKTIAFVRIDKDTNGND